VPSVSSLRARFVRALPWLAAVHLLIALIYSTHLHVEHFIPPWIEVPMRVYGNFSGAHTHFNFFAPTVVTQVRVVFKLGQADGSTREIRVNTDSAEVNQRLSIMFNFYLRPNARKAVVDAWAQHMLATHPEAQWVQTRVEMLEIPPLSEVARGRRAEWLEVGRYGATREPAPVR
jgi:hypothetical protein